MSFFYFTCNNSDELPPQPSANNLQPIPSANLYDNSNTKKGNHEQWTTTTSFVRIEKRNTGEVKCRSPVSTTSRVMHDYGTHIASQ